MVSGVLRRPYDPPAIVLGVTGRGLLVDPDADEAAFHYGMLFFLRSYCGLLECFLSFYGRWAMGEFRKEFEAMWANGRAYYGSDDDASGRIHTDDFKSRRN